MSEQDKGSFVAAWDLPAEAIDAVLDAIDAGIVVLDGRGQLRAANAMASRLAGATLTPGMSARECLALIAPRDTRDEPLRCADYLAWHERGEGPLVAELHVGTGAAQRVLSCRATRLPGDAVVVVARDVTHERAQMQAGAAADQTAKGPDLPVYFVAAVSHELRTPLTTILGSAEALLKSWMRLDNAARRKSVERLLSGARRLDLLVRDLLLVTELEEGELEVRAARTPLAPVLEQALYDASAIHPNLDVRARGLRNAPAVWADPARVAQILVHLLDNAARHGQGAGPAEVRVESHGAAVRIWVSDRGPGLPTEGRERLFTRFGKLSQASHAGRVGTGLGLYVCRRLVEMMGGAIGVESTPGKGASFWFTLPLADEGGRDGR